MIKALLASRFDSNSFFSQREVQFMRRHPLWMVYAASSFIYVGFGLMYAKPAYFVVLAVQSVMSFQNDVST